MALRNLHGMRPNDYLKPPFHTYLNHLFVLKPIREFEQVARKVARRKVVFNEARLMASRLLVIALSVGTIALSFLVARTASGLFAARVIALLLATSAGFVVYNHFLTCDAPLLFWMLLAFFVAQRILRSAISSNYVATGLLTGVAAATKYNGLAIGITLVVAHLLSAERGPLFRIASHRRLLLGLVMIPAGFILANPYSVLEWRKFSADFLYNYAVSPRYEGQSGYGYGKFIAAIPQLIGSPAAWLVAGAALASLMVILGRRRLASFEAKTFALATATVLLYFAKMGAFPRVPMRFVLPVIPFLLLLIAPALQAAARRPRLVSLLIAPVIIYNCACSFVVGTRFNQDPRTGAQWWMLQHLGRDRTIESSGGSPHWAKLPELNAAETKADRPVWEKRKNRDALDVRMPRFNRRAELFQTIFAGDERVIPHLAEHEKSADERPFSEIELQQRNPDVITLHSFDYDSASETARAYYDLLLQGKLSYRVAFDVSTPAPPKWAYPSDIDFLSGRMTILERAGTDARQ